MIEMDYVYGPPAITCYECFRSWEDPAAADACCTSQGYVGPHRCCFCDCTNCDAPAPDLDDEE